MNIEKLIKDNVEKIAKSGSKIFVTPDIPEKKLNNAVEYIAKGVDPNYVLALLDTTIFGSAKEGIVFVGDKLFINNGGRRVYEFVKIQKIEKQSYTVENKDGEGVIKHKYILTYDNEEEDITSYIFGADTDGFIELIELILQNIAEGDGKLETTNQACPLSMMSSEIKEKYLKLICNYAYSDDGMVDSKEYAEIMSLIAVNSIESEVRFKIRTYMYKNSDMESNDDLIAYLEKHVDAGSLEALKLSAVKDTINLFWSKMSENKETDEWKSCDYIVELTKRLKIEETQVDYIVENIKSNKAIIENRQDDIQIKKSMQELAAKAGAVGVPLAAIYLSGSVIGVSAAGMTSGLAALGMGGILGFSSMFTGIGVAVLLGVGAYKGVKKVTGIGAIENNKQREMMLQEIARNSQKSLNYLIEDVNEISVKLCEAVKAGQENEFKIQKLSGLLTMMSKGAKQTTMQIEFAEKEKVICKLPVRIKPDFIEEMAAGATKKPIRELIYSAYNAERIDEEGNTITNCLNAELSRSDLESVYQALEGIGFYNVAENSKAMASKMTKGLMKGLLK